MSALSTNYKQVFIELKKIFNFQDIVIFVRSFYKLMDLKFLE